MGIRFFLRHDSSKSYFRDALFRLIETPDVTQVVLGSGYFQEPIPYARGRYSVLNDGLLQQLINSESREVVTIGGKLSGLWAPRYRTFVRTLQGTNLNVIAYRARRNNWHAKVAFAVAVNHQRAITHRRVLAALLGSSNLTGPAFEEGQRIRFNHEADMLMWVDEDKYDLHFRKEPSSDIRENPFSPIDLVLNPKSSQLKEGDRLNAFYDEVMSERSLRAFE